MPAFARFVCFAAMLLVAAPGCSRSLDRAEGVTHVDRARAHELVASGATLLDVRTRSEFDARHATGAVNVPVGELEARLNEVPRGRPVETYCAAGVRSAVAASKLKAAGYTVYDLGSLAAWGEPITR